LLFFKNSKMKFFLIALGGATGTLLRYLFYLPKYNSEIVKDLPISTLLVNLIGSLLIGVFWGLLGNNPDERIRHFLFIGLFGGFTTFSTFAFENFSMIKTGNILNSILYTTISCVFGIILVWIGFAAGKYLTRI